MKQKIVIFNLLKDEKTDLYYMCELELYFYDDTPGGEILKKFPNSFETENLAIEFCIENKDKIPGLRYANIIIQKIYSF